MKTRKKIKNLEEVIIENALRAYFRKCRFKRLIRSIARKSNSRLEAVEKICNEVKVGPKEAERMYIKYTWNTNFYYE